jgi:hypothetical protein
VTFALWDDHIYDAWVKKAKELNFKPETDAMLPVASLTEKDKPQTKEKSVEKDNQGLSADNVFANTKLIDPDSPSASATESDPKLQDMVDRLPSVPSDQSDTQQTAEMGGDDTDKDDKAAALEQQKTYVTSTAEQLVI